MAFIAGLDPLVFNDRIQELEEKGFLQVREYPAGCDFNITGFLDEVKKQTQPPHFQGPPKEDFPF